MDRRFPPRHGPLGCLRLGRLGRARLSPHADPIFSRNTPRRKLAGKVTQVVAARVSDRKPPLPHPRGLEKKAVSEKFGKKTDRGSGRDGNRSPPTKGDTMIRPAKDHATTKNTRGQMPAPLQDDEAIRQLLPTTVQAALAAGMDEGLVRARANAATPAGAAAAGTIGVGWRRGWARWGCGCRRTARCCSPARCSRTGRPNTPDCACGWSPSPRKPSCFIVSPVNTTSTSSRPACLNGSTRSLNAAPTACASSPMRPAARG
jgi:hypothetical protein